MTNFLSTAMLSAGAACFGSIIEMEKNMSQAEIKTLQASETMMDVQPHLLTALMNSYDAQANDILVSGEIAGGTAIGSGVTQIGLSIGGHFAGQAAYDEPLESNATKINYEQISKGTNITDEQGEGTPANSATPKSIVVADNSSKEQVNDSTNTSEKQKDVAANEGKQKTADEIKADAEKAQKAARKEKKEAEKATREAKKETDEITRTKEQKRQTTIQTWQNYTQLAGTTLNGVGTVVKSPFDMSAKQNEGSASAVNTIISANQTAQSSYANMVQTYKEAFTNASQILAGIVSAQRN